MAPEKHSADVRSADDRRSYVEIRRSFVASASVGALVAFVVFVVLLQGGRDGLLGRDLLGNFYDGQARSIVNGHLDVPADVPGFEGFVIDGRTYIYQGLAPVIPRLPIAEITELHGRLTGLSMIFAQLMTLAYIVVAAWRTRLSVRGLVPMTRYERLVAPVAIFGVSTGLIAFLASRAWVYHEASAWGVALTLGGLVHLAIWLDGRSGEAADDPKTPGMCRQPLLHVSVATLFAGLAFNSRSSVGVGPLLALGICAGVLTFEILRRRSSSQMRSSLAALLIIGIGSGMLVGFYGAINYARFGTLISVPLDRQRLVQMDPLRTKALDANGGSLFGLAYTPSVLTQLLRPDAVESRSVFPYVGFPSERPSVVGSVVFAERDFSTSIPNSAPLGFVAGLIGIVVVVIPSRFAAESERLRRLRIPVIGAFLSGAPILVFGYMAQRYMLDFYPFVVLSALVGLNAGARWLLDDAVSSHASPLSRRRVVAGVGITALALAGAWVTSSVTLQYQREIAPGLTSVNRPGWLADQLRFPGRFDLNRVRGANDLPTGQTDRSADGRRRPRPIGQPAVIGRCNALYRWSGHDWLLIESTGLKSDQPTGFTVTVRSDGGNLNHSNLRLIERTPAGSDDVEAIELVDLSGAVGLRATYDPTPSQTVLDKELPTGFEFRFDVTEDPRHGELLIRPHGVQRELLSTFSTTASGGWRVPTDLPEGASVELETLSTPLCDRLMSVTGS